VRYFHKTRALAHLASFAPNWFAPRSFRLNKIKLRQIISHLKQVGHLGASGRRPLSAGPPEFGRAGRAWRKSGSLPFAPEGCVPLCGGIAGPNPEDWCWLRAEELGASELNRSSAVC